MRRRNWFSRLRCVLAVVPLLALLLPLLGVATPLVATVAAAPEAGDPGVLWSWGFDGSGQLGDGAVGGETHCGGNLCAPLPAKIVASDLPTFVAVAAAGTAQNMTFTENAGHNLALTAAGAIWSWGYDANGQLGDGTVAGETACGGLCAPTPAPIATPDGKTFIAIDAAENTSLALASDGSVWAWGNDDYGQLGDGTVGGNADCGGSCAATPQAIAVPAGTTFVAIAAGATHSLALTASGVIWSWGNDDDGQLGDGAVEGEPACADTCDPSPAPIAGSGLPVFTAIAAGGIYSAGGNFSLALAADGSVWSWGYDAGGQLGDGASFGEVACTGKCAPTPAPIAVPSETTFTAIAAGGGHSLALAADGTVWAWGDGGYGQVGDDGSGSATPSPVVDSGQPAFQAIAAGDYISVALTVDGVAWSWGHNDWGELGFGVTGGSSSRSVPGLVTMPTGVAFGSISAGLGHVVAIDPDPVPTSTGAVGASATAGDASVALTATVTRQANGAPVPVGGTVTFTYNGATYQGTTGAAGVATTTAPLPPGIPAGTVANAVTASYAGTVDYLSSQGSGSLVVAPGSSPSPSPSPSPLPSNPGFADVDPSDPYYAAIAGLVAQGVIQGFDTTPPTFGPEQPVQRSQVAAMIVRALEWQGRPAGPRAFSDVPNPGDELQRAALILANACDAQGNCVARGYDDGQFGVYANVSHAEVIAFVVRAFGLDSAHGWQVQAGATPYSGVPAQFADWVATYHRYAGTIPEAPTTQAGWDTPAKREWVAQVLWVALQSAP